MVIVENIFNVSFNIGNYKKDYVMYFKGFEGMVVWGNYVRGWFVDVLGGIKVCNG